jgi:hypothetical protein
VDVQTVNGDPPMQDLTRSGSAFAYYDQRED